MNKKRYWRTNEQIHAQQVRVLDEKGDSVGILPVSKALEKAKKANLDLVEIAPLAQPPVAKIIDFNKFKYQELKKLKKQTKSAKTTDLKEVRFSPFIGEADYQMRLEKVRGFLKEGHKVRAVVKFKGRQMGSKRFGYNLLQKLLTDINTEINVDMQPKFIGRHLAMVISPTNRPQKKE